MSLAKIKFDYVLLAVFALYLVLVFVAGRGQAEGTSAIMVFAFLCIFRLFSGIDTLGGVRYWYCENRSRVWQLLVAIAVLAAFTFYRATTDGTPLWTAAISIAFATAFFFASISIHTWVIAKFKKSGLCKASAFDFFIHINGAWNMPDRRRKRIFDINLVRVNYPDRPAQVIVTNHQSRPCICRTCMFLIEEKKIRTLNR